MILNIQMDDPITQKQLKAKERKARQLSRQSQESLNRIREEKVESQHHLSLSLMK